MGALLQELVNRPYKHGFVTDIESDVAAKGLNEDTIRLISAKKNEPEWLLEFRLKAFRHWLTMTQPHWANVQYPQIDFQAISYYSAPKPKPKLASMDEVDPELLRTFEKLGVPMNERAELAGVAVDVIFDSVSVATTYKAKLAEVGIIFCSISEAVQKHPELVRKYLGTVVPSGDNFYAALNSAVFTDGSFCFIPKGVQVPDGAVDVLPHQHRGDRPVRAHADRRRGRRVGVATSRAAPRRSSTPTSCTPRWSSWSRSTTPTSSTRPCRTGTPATRTAWAASTTSSPSAACARASDSRISWTQVETGSAITWKYPSCVLRRRQLGRRVLLGRADQPPPAGRHRHEDDPHRQEHAQHDRQQGHLGRPVEQHLPRPGEDPADGRTARATTRSATRC